MATKRQIDEWREQLYMLDGKTFQIRNELYGLENIHRGQEVELATFAQHARNAVVASEQLETLLANMRREMENVEPTVT